MLIHKASVSPAILRRLLAHIEAEIGRPLRLDWSDWRAGDQRYFVADARAIRAALDLPAPKDWRDGVSDLMRWLEAEGLDEAATPPKRLVGVAR